MFGRNLKIRGLLILIVVLAAGIYLVPSIKPNLPDFWKKYMPGEKIHLGLDLQGGMHLILEVDTDKAVESALERTANDLKETLMDKRVRFTNLERVKNAIIVELAGNEARKSFDETLGDNYPILKHVTTETTEGKEQIRLTFTDKQVESIKKFALDQSLETIRNRVDQFGVSEPEIVPQGRERILIQLPGVKDTQRAINLIGKTALLEFKLVDEENSLESAIQGAVPAGDLLIYGVTFDRNTNRKVKIPYLLKEKTLLTGQSLEDAKVQIGDRFGEPYVSIKFDAQGARDFDRITNENVKRRLAIVLDGVVHSAPVIQERISGGRAQITGSFTMDEAHDLAIVLRAGALPAPVRILEQRSVGPSLGQDSIDKGLLSIIIGSILVVIFMVLYYKLGGLVANTALLLNIILILGALAAFRATLTLPGIAGIVLTIGMAVDANVLVFERIREELRLGKAPSAAVTAGYSRAFLTIVDANVTTLIAAVVLFQFGTGPVKGFAVTLSIGILCSMFTAIFVTRTIFDYFIWRRKIATVSV
ncbi:MAG: protein translocase subunit SecD [Deltaproteobacteria bacterium]|nr:protein translocase subunit SecD [Deltaproteobacteria bacterium]